MLPVLEFGPLTIRTPGLALLAALWLGLEIASREGARRGLPGDRIYDLGFLVVVAAMLGARFGYVLIHLSTYLKIRPIPRIVTSVFALAPGTENVWTGLLIGVIFLVVLAKKWQLAPIALADTFAPGLSILVVGIGLANLLSGDYYGAETNVFWGIFLWGAKRHPTQLYLIAFALVSLIIMRRLQGDAARGKQDGDLPENKLAAPSQPGLIIQAFISVLSLGLLLIEPFRADSPVIGPGIRVWEIVALLGLVGALGSFAYHPPDLRPDTR